MQRLVYLCDGLHVKRDLVAMELRVLRVLDYRLSGATLHGAQLERRGREAGLQERLAMDACLIEGPPCDMFGAVTPAPAAIRQKWPSLRRKY